MSTYVALLRGINVGTAKAVPMAQLSAVIEGLGFSAVKTVLRSGNVVFDGDADADAAASVERALLEAVGVQSSVLVLGDHEFRRIVAANPLNGAITDGSRGFVTFLSAPAPAVLTRPSEDELAPELLRVTESAVYQWIPGGSLQSKLGRAFWAQFASPVTTRNINTVTKLVGLLDR